MLFLGRYSSKQLRARSQRGLTLLELLIVIAIIGIALVALSSGLNILTNFALSEDSDELAAMMRRASQLAVERGEQHRVVFDLEKGGYRIDVCQGPAAIARNEAIDVDREKVEQAIQKGQEKLKDVPADALAVGDPDAAMARAKALAGHHIADRTCSPAQGDSGVHHSVTKKSLQIGDEEADWIRALNRKVKFEEIWVQHKEGSTKGKGEVAVYFFPDGSSEKAVIQLTDGDARRNVLVYGLTGQIEQRSGKIDVDAHMLRNAMGGKDKEREGDK